MCVPQPEAAATQKPASNSLLMAVKLSVFSVLLCGPWPSGQEGWGSADEHGFVCGQVSVCGQMGRRAGGDGQVGISRCLKQVGCITLFEAGGLHHPV